MWPELDLFENNFINIVLKDKSPDLIFLNHQTTNVTFF